MRLKVHGQWDEVIDQVGLRALREGFEDSFILGWRPFTASRGDQEARIFARDEDPDPPELHLIEAVEITGRAVIEVNKVDLSQMRLGETRIAYGEFHGMGREGISGRV
ncbi:MAG: hypothetical protein WD269_02195 [Acidimicrobiia bacterium]